MAYHYRHPKGPYIACDGHRKFVRFEVFRGHPIQGTLPITFDDLAKRCFGKAGGAKVSEERMSIISHQYIGLL